MCLRPSPPGDAPRPIPGYIDRKIDTFHLAADGNVLRTPHPLDLSGILKLAIPQAMDFWFPNVFLDTARTARDVETLVRVEGLEFNKAWSPPANAISRFVDIEDLEPPSKWTKAIVRIGDDETLEKLIEKIREEEEEFEVEMAENPHRWGQCQIKTIVRGILQGCEDESTAGFQDLLRNSLNRREPSSETPRNMRYRVFLPVTEDTRPCLLDGRFIEDDEIEGVENTEGTEGTMEAQEEVNAAA